MSLPKRDLDPLDLLLGERVWVKESSSPGEGGREGGSSCETRLDLKVGGEGGGVYM